MQWLDAFVVDKIAATVAVVVVIIVNIIDKLRTQ